LRAQIEEQKIKKAQLEAQIKEEKLKQEEEEMAK